MGTIGHLRKEKGFLQIDVIGRIDAPAYTVAGSTIANEIYYPEGHYCSDLNGRYVIPNIACRG
jgi:hypothetical protein